MATKKTSLELLDSPPPSAEGSETALLAGFMVRGRVDPDCCLRGDQFYSTRNASLYNAMTELEAEMGQWDAPSLIGRLQHDPAWGKDGFDSGFVAQTFTQAANPALGPYHSRQIKEAWRRRVAGQKSLELYQLSHGDCDPDQIHELAESIKRVFDDDNQSRSQLPKIQDACEFCDTAMALPDELIQGVLHRGSKLSVGGASKSYKTWTLMNMALSVAYGLPWLGCATTQAKVLVVNLEIQSAFACKRLRVLAEAMGITQEPNHLDMWNLRGHATCHQQIFPKIIDRISDGGYGLIILDPIYKLYGGTDNENGAREVGALMNSIETMAVDTGAAVAFAAHFSKGNQAGKEAIDRVSGSGVFARDPDSLLSFTSHREQDCYTVEATLRNFPALPPFVVRWEYPLFTRDCALNPAELKAPGKSIKDKAAEQEHRENEQRARLLKALQEKPDGDTAKSLRTTAGLNYEDFGRAIMSLMQEGRAESCRVKKHTRTEDGYKPTEI